MTTYRTFTWPKFKFKRILLPIIVILVLLGSFTVVPAGNRGVVLRFGAVTGQIFAEGLHFKIPFVDRVVLMDVQIQKAESAVDAASQDLQSVQTTIALNYQLNDLEVDTVYQDLRQKYVTRIIEPSIEESVKSAIAEFTAEELITRRSEVRDTARMKIVEKLEPQGIAVVDLNIVNFSFSDAFDRAIEAKVTAEQDALAAKNKLEQVKFEAQQAVEEAKGKAEAIEVEAKALARNPLIIELRALEKWDGILPTVTGGTVPFINVD